MTLERHPGEWTFDPKANAMYVTLRGPIPRGGVDATLPVDATVNIDLDKDGRMIGVEIVTRWWPEEEATDGA
ncbi:DUF2283 domain-containing protein [Nonomuraea sp. NPDC050643]|uniref:DUF2283 domain-containing protein n=1 Tax=Nonomuraea sp. NPDC050643 TaxID=3155660 RepID=UPI0034043EAB